MIYDVAVVGGGINGAGVAREAAYRGYTTLLLEKYDFAQATSSESTKLIHGGLRYLEHAQVGMVWESLRERRTLLHIAPHLVKPLELIIPIYRGAPRPPWMIRVGTLMYDVLAGRKNLGKSRGVGRKELEAIPFLRQEGLRGAVAYYDAQTSDSRLTLETILSAQEAGATVRNYTSVERVRLDGGEYELECRDARTGQPVRFRARSVVNATGPWVPLFERATQGHPTRPMVYDRGIHFVIPALGITKGLYLMASDKRLVFVLPWMGRYTLIGTTESIYGGEDFAHVPPSEEEIAYLLGIFNEYFPARALKREEVLHIHSGVRALIAPKGGTLASASRESEIAVHSDAPGTAWLIVYGGKLTSYRAYAVEILDRLVKRIGAPVHGKHLDTAATPLYGAVAQPPPAPAASPAVSERQRAIWRDRYGTRDVELEQRVRANPALAEVLVPEHGFTRADLAYMVEVEQAFLLEDVLLRRTLMAYDITPAERARVEEGLRALVQKQGWAA